MRTRVTSIARLPTRMRSVVAMASPALSVVCTENLNSRRGQPATATEAPTGSVRARLPISRPKFSRSRNGQDTTANNRSRCRRRWGHRRTQSHESHGGNAQRGAPARAIIEEQDRLIAERSGTPAIAVKSIHRSGSKKKPTKPCDRRDTRQHRIDDGADDQAAARTKLFPNPA
jgi:hypothetical protein